MCTYVPYMKSLATTMRPEALYTDDNNDATDNDYGNYNDDGDNTTSCMHWLPLAIGTNQSTTTTMAPIRKCKGCMTCRPYQPKRPQRKLLRQIDLKLVKKSLTNDLIKNETPQHWEGPV